MILCKEIECPILPDTKKQRKNTKTQRNAAHHAAMVSLASAVLPSSGNWNSLARTQLEILQTLVKKHLRHGKVTVGEITRYILFGSVTRECSLSSRWKMWKKQKLRT